MRRTRIIFSLAIFSNFVTSACLPAFAAPACLQPGEAQGFSIIGLKSALMVDALTCNLGQNYDSFMIKFQPQILDAQHQMDGYFERAGGLAGQALEDQFTTQLANGESDAAAGQGAGFCGQAAKQFAAVAGLGGTMDLLSYAVQLKLASPPGAPGLCPAAPPVVVASAPPPKPGLAAPKPTVRVAAVHKPHHAAPVTPPPSPYMVAQTI